MLDGVIKFDAILVKILVMVIDFLLRNLLVFIKVP